MRSSSQGNEAGLSPSHSSREHHPHHAHYHEKEKDHLIVLGFNVSYLSKPQQFVLGTLGVFVFYILYGYIQEKIFKLDGFQPYGVYLTLVQFAFYTILSFIECLATNALTRKVPLRTYMFIASLTVATMALSNSSVGYLNYPTQVMFKCCKLIPTMIGGMLIMRKSYHPLDVVAMLCMCCGLAMFTLADSTVQPNFNTFGVFLISLALCADGVIGNVQEKTMKAYSSSSAEMVFYSYGIGFFYILLLLVLTGNLIPAIQFSSRHIVHVYGNAFLFSVTGYCGVQFVLLLVCSYGALPAVTVTTCRKAVTIVLSFFFFQKPFTFSYLWSGLLVLMGIYMNIYSKNRVAWNAAFDSWLSRVIRGHHQQRDIDIV